MGVRIAPPSPNIAAIAQSVERDLCSINICMEENLTCKYCSSVRKNLNSLRNHERTCPKNKDRLYMSYTLGKPAWNKGLTKDTDKRVAKYAKSLIGNKNGAYKSEETLKRLSEHAKKRGLGGYKPHPNRGERYRDVWFDSKWEVSVAKSLDEHNIEWERPSTGFVWNDKGNKYYPDFYLPEYNVYLDPKNDYLISKDAVKINEAMRRNSIRVLILTKDYLYWENIRTLL